MLPAGEEKVRPSWTGGAVSLSNLKNQALSNGSFDSSVRILVVSGDYSCKNMGDVAMLIVAIETLRAMWPSAMISVLTLDPVSLADHCFEVHPISHRGRALWFSTETFSGRLQELIPTPHRAILSNLHVILRERSP